MSDTSLAQIKKVKALQESAEKFLLIETSFLSKEVEKISYLKRSGFTIYTSTGSYDIYNEEVHYEFPSLTISADYSKLPYGPERDRFEFCWLKISSTEQSPKKYKVDYRVDNIIQSLECEIHEFHSVIEIFSDLTKEFSKLFKIENKRIKNDMNFDKIFLLIVLGGLAFSLFTLLQ